MEENKRKAFTPFYYTLSPYSNLFSPLMNLLFHCWPLSENPPKREREREGGECIIGIPLILVRIITEFYSVILDNS